MGAIAGTLSIMVGGTDEGFERAGPILAALGKTIVHVGPAGAGQVVKVCNQVVVALVIEAVAEAPVLAPKPALTRPYRRCAAGRARRDQGPRDAPRQYAVRPVRPGIPHPAASEGPQERPGACPRDECRPAGGGPG